jgi:hypothetical protein
MSRQILVMLISGRMVENTTLPLNFQSQPHLTVLLGTLALEETSHGSLHMDPSEGLGGLDMSLGTRVIVTEPSLRWFFNLGSETSGWF